MPAKKKTASKKVAKKADNKATKTATDKSNGKTDAPAAKKAPDEKTKALVLGARRRSNTPSMFKVKKGKTPVVFTMEDVAQILETKKPETQEDKPKVAKKAAKSVPEVDDAPVENRAHNAASLADILGFNPTERKASDVPPGRQVPKKWQKHYKLLLELRQHVTEELEIHTADTLKRSNRDDSGDLSGYGQHMADAGTDTFDRDFALSLVSNEQEALYEIEEAIQRIFDDEYGVCEHTGEPIDKERLLAVPFTRFSLEGQRQMERTRKQKSHRGGVFSNNDDNDLSLGGDDDDN
ncbi:TraR/DksA family transcriptional regulator [Cerasicoccus fimbriatus]|uniref:TraR/DksA family transcriptional regulator n=1 Tax=Cerasicoccus fimbriatus TaxID=3014554 RepID=UPI0022B52105|nr:TraR/DksA C4-type zinc finger protein [Cerasicoccus sp. TK19100]